MITSKNTCSFHIEKYFQEFNWESHWDKTFIKYFFPFMTNIN